MFHREADASKVALVTLVELLRERGATLLDVQWATPHMVSLGAIEVSRGRYHELLADALGRSVSPLSRECNAPRDRAAGADGPPAESEALGQPLGSSGHPGSVDTGTDLAEGLRRPSPAELVDRREEGPVDP